MSDHRHGFVFQERALRGVHAQCDGLMSDVLARHSYPAILQPLLGDLMLACALLSAHLKDDSALTLQLRGPGPLSLAMAECSAQGDVRVYGHYEAARLQPDMSFSDLLGAAQLALTLEHAGQRYQGIVQLQAAGLALSLETYFAQSEQLPSLILLAHQGERHAGLLLQALPGATATEDFEYASVLARTCRDAELLDLDSATLLHRLYHEDDLSLAPTAPLRFHCRCDRQRSLDALLSLGSADLEKLLMERHGSIDVDCELCRQRQTFTTFDLLAYLQPTTRVQ